MYPGVPSSWQITVSRALSYYFFQLFAILTFFLKLIPIIYIVKNIISWLFFFGSSETSETHFLLFHLKSKLSSCHTSSRAVTASILFIAEIKPIFQTMNKMRDKTQCDASWTLPGWVPTPYLSHQPLCLRACGTPSQSRACRQNPLVSPRSSASATVCTSSRDEGTNLHQCQCFFPQYIESYINL